LDFAAGLKLASSGFIESPIKGAAGNQEYLTLLRWEGT